MAGSAGRELRTGCRFQLGEEKELAPGARAAANVLKMRAGARSCSEVIFPIQLLIRTRDHFRQADSDYRAGYQADRFGHLDA